jgi:hypothetical protein
VKTWARREFFGLPIEKRFRPFGAQCPGGFAVEKELETGLTASKIRVFHLAGVAQLVEHFLAKEDVARSNRVTRFPLPEQLREGSAKQTSRMRSSY